MVVHQGLEYKFHYMYVFLCAFLFMKCDAVFQFISVAQYLLSIIFTLKSGICYSIQNEQIAMVKVELWG